MRGRCVDVCGMYVSLHSSYPTYTSCLCCCGMKVYVLENKPTSHACIHTYILVYIHSYAHTITVYLPTRKGSCMTQHPPHIHKYIHICIHTYVCPYNHSISSNSKGRCTGSCMTQPQMQRPHIVRSNTQTKEPGSHVILRRSHVTLWNSHVTD